VAVETTKGMSRAVNNMKLLKTPTTIRGAAKGYEDRWAGHFENHNPKRSGECVLGNVDDGRKP